ncbi:MAG TPA: zinc ribbon domain-containing protein [Acidobacteriota bacterium]|nr:zinc ribbon domain-containing protein [Acidobacteriota bacterium]
MPIYEYTCEECKQEFEALVRPDEIVNCPKCSSNHLTKQYSRFGMAHSSDGKYDSLPLYKGGCGCTPSTCGCKN